MLNFRAPEFFLALWSQAGSSVSNAPTSQGHLINVSMNSRGAGRGFLWTRGSPYHLYNWNSAQNPGPRPKKYFWGDLVLVLIQPIAPPSAGIHTSTLPVTKPVCKLSSAETREGVHHSLVTRPNSPVTLGMQGFQAGSSVWHTREETGAPLSERWQLPVSYYCHTWS